MSYIDSILNSIQEIAKQGISELDNPNSLVGTVVSIDTTNNTCVIQPLDVNRTVIQNVLLTSDSGAKPLYIPALGTQVTVTLYSSNSGYVSQHGAVKSTSVSPGTVDYGGFVKVQPTVDAFVDLQKKVNTIINWLEDFVNKYNLHTHILTLSVGTGTAAPTTSQELTTTESLLTETVKADLENTAAVHGNGTSNNTAYNEQILQARIALNIANTNLASLEADLAIANNNMFLAGTDTIKVSSATAIVVLTSKQVDEATKIRDEKQNDLDKLIKNPK